MCNKSLKSLKYIKEEKCIKDCVISPGSEDYTCQNWLNVQIKLKLIPTRSYKNQFPTSLHNKFFVPGNMN